MNVMRSIGNWIDKPESVGFQEWRFVLVVFNFLVVLIGGSVGIGYLFGEGWGFGVFFFTIFVVLNWLIINGTSGGNE